MPRKASLLIVFLTVFIDLLGFGMVLPLLPIYAKQFGVDKHGVTLGLLMASFSAMQFLFAPIWGRISDRIGRRPVLLIGLGGSAFFYGLFGLATLWQSLSWLFVARIGAGIAGATISTAQAYIADCTGLENRAKGMALIGAAFGLGFTFGPLLGAAALVFSASVGTSPWPGYTAAALSGVSFLMATFMLAESLNPDSRSAAHKWFDATSLRDALATPSVGALLLSSLVSILSFGAFETTVSLLLNLEGGGFEYDYYQVLLFFAYIGLVLSFAQGFLVRRAADLLSEPVMAVGGVLTSIAGFVVLALSSGSGRLIALAAASAIMVTGFAFVTPSLNSLISRRSDPARQGGIMGVTQSVGALGRIVGPLISIPLFYAGTTLPYWVAAALMAVGLAMVVYASRSGRDFSQAAA